MNVKELGSAGDLGSQADLGVEKLGEMPPGGTPIYRYMSATRYFDLVEKKILSLSHITLWEDPYEGFLFRAIADSAHDEQAKMCVYDLFKYYYGQSWTINGVESDETWRAHGKRGTVVRVKTTVAKLCQCLTGMAKGPGMSRPVSSDVKAGLVQYAKSDAEFKQLLSANSLFEALNGVEQDRLRMFFIKRYQFRSEDEFRVMVHANENDLDRVRDTDGRFLKIIVDPKEIIDEVIVDPCMSRQEYEQLICRTRHYCNNICPRQSDLFDWPQIVDRELPAGFGLERRFWSRLQETYPDDPLNLKGRTPSHRSYWQISYGQDLFFFYFTNSEARVEYYVPACDKPENETRFTFVQQHRTEIEGTTGPLVWDDLPNRKARKIKKVMPDVSIRDEESWDGVCEWLRNEMVKLVQAITSVLHNQGYM